MTEVLEQRPIGEVGDGFVGFQQDLENIIK